MRLPTLPKRLQGTRREIVSIRGLNLTDNGNLPVEEAREQLGEVSFLLPFSREIRSAMSCGNLYAKNAGDKVWTGRMREIAAQVVGNAG